MGHRVRSGYVREVEVAGAKMLRIDIPVDRDEVGQDVMVTEFYSAPAIYALRPAAEAIVRAELTQYGADPRPVRPVDYRPRARLTEQVADDEEDGDDGVGRDDVDLFVKGNRP